MKMTTKSAARRAAGLIALPALLACGTALADATASRTGQPGLLSLPNVTIVTATAEQLRAAAKPAAASSGVRAFKDPETGRLRAATPEELVAIAEEAPALSEQPVAVFRHSSGALVAEVGESAMTYSVARKAAGGRLDLQCVAGPEEARKTLGAAVAPKEHDHAH